MVLTGAVWRPPQGANPYPVTGYPDDSYWNNLVTVHRKPHGIPWFWEVELLRAGDIVCSHRKGTKGRSQQFKVAVVKMLLTSV
jgi:hypothetical protein